MQASSSTTQIPLSPFSFDNFIDIFIDYIRNLRPDHVEGGQEVLARAGQLCCDLEMLREQRNFFEAQASFYQTSLAQAYQTLFDGFASQIAPNDCTPCVVQEGSREKVIRIRTTKDASNIIPLDPAAEKGKEFLVEEVVYQRIFSLFNGVVLCILRNVVGMNFAEPIGRVVLYMRHARNLEAIDPLDLRKASAEKDVPFTYLGKNVNSDKISVMALDDGPTSETRKFCKINNASCCNCYKRVLLLSADQFKIDNKYIPGRTYYLWLWEVLQITARQQGNSYERPYGEY
jgi:hypothetical protein